MLLLLFCIKGRFVWIRFGLYKSRIQIKKTITLYELIFCFDTKMLLEAFEHKVLPEKTAMHLKRDITDSLVKEFLLK